MRKFTSISVIVLLCVVASIAQNKVNFSGDWELSLERSKFDFRSRIESMTMKVTQNDKELRVETQTKYKPPTEARSDMGQGMRRGNFLMSSDMPLVYSLDGKERTINQETPMGTFPVSLKAKLEENGTLKLTRVRVLSTPMGEISMTSKEIWKLGEDGKTLTIKQEIETPRGVMTSEMFFIKK
ncbi:MAG: hypothetical protein D6735_01970 [Acidobacteria bacterium]|nr:MAG: hypothetical protein D6735_01970 [Acidobacteriota bacterium]